MARLQTWLEANGYGEGAASTPREDGYLTAVADANDIMLGVDGDETIEPFVDTVGESKRRAAAEMLGRRTATPTEEEKPQP
jgi:hypothetical protein